MGYYYYYYFYWQDQKIMQTLFNSYTVSSFNKNYAKMPNLYMKNKYTPTASIGTLGPTEKERQQQ